MKLKVLDIPEEGLDISAKASADSWLSDLVQEAYQEDYRKGNDASLQLHVLKTCDNVSLTGTAEIDIHPSCDRCLEVFKKHLRIPLHVDLAPYREIEYEAGEEVELTEDDMNFSFYKGEEIDVGDIVREMLVIEIPIQYLCAESCKGLCSQCGKNLNLGACSCAPQRGDPRFAVLKTLLKSTE
jgi:uncharacterized protein